MITKELEDFIKAQLDKGITKEFISNELIANGWKAEDVEEGFNSVPVVVPPPAAITTSDMPTYTVSPESVELARKSGGMFWKILIPILVLGLLGGGYYFYKTKLSGDATLSDGMPVATPVVETPVVAPEIPPTPVIPPVPTIIAAQTALDNFAKVTSFTFTGSESGKSSISGIASKFSGGFSNTSGATCSLLRTITVKTTTFDLEDRLISGTTYEFVKGSKNTTINDKWTQIVKGKEDFSITHLPVPLKDISSVCAGQLPLLSVVTVGDLLRKTDTENVYALTLNADALKVYSGDNLTKNVPGGQVPTGELTVDLRTALPTKITLSSSAFPDPLFDFEITTTDVPVYVMVPPGFGSADTKSISHVFIQGHDVSYPSLWTTKSTESIASCTTLACQTSIAQSGGLATKLIPLNSDGSDYIYIGTNDPTQEYCADTYSFCKILVPGGDGVQGIMVWTTTSKTDVIAVAQGIVVNWK